MIEVEIPEPEESGSDGRQVKSESTGDLIPAQSLSSPIVRAINGIASSNARSLGSEVGSILIAAATSQLAADSDELKRELTQLRQRNEKLAGDLSSEQRRRAVLSERIDAYRSTSHLKNLSIAIGTLCIGFGIQLIQSGSGIYGISAVLLGTLILFFSWFSAPKEGEK